MQGTNGQPYTAALSQHHPSTLGRHYVPWQLGAYSIAGVLVRAAIIFFRRKFSVFHWKPVCHCRGNKRGTNPLHLQETCCFPMCCCEPSHKSFLRLLQHLGQDLFVQWGPKIIKHYRTNSHFDLKTEARRFTQIVFQHSTVKFGNVTSLHMTSDKDNKLFSMKKAKLAQSSPLWCSSFLQGVLSVSSFPML